MKKLIIFLHLSCFLHFLYAQRNNVDSINKIETTIQVLKMLGGDSSSLEQLKQIAASEPDNESRAVTLFTITANYLNKSLDSSLKYIKEFNAIPAKAKLWEGNGFVIMGDIYLRLGNASLALENMLKGTKVLQELNDSAGIGMAYWNLGKLYESMDDFSKAKNYYLNSIKIVAPSNIITPLSYSMGHLGNLYLELNNFDSALYFTQSAYEIPKKDRANYDPILLAQLGNIYQRKGDIALALKQYRMALQQAEPSDNFAAGSDACLGLAMLFKSEKLYDSCYFYARKSFDLAQQLNREDLILKASRFLKDFFKERNTPDSAFSYQEIMIAANDSLYSLEKINQVLAISFAEQQRAAEEENQKKEFQNKMRQNLLIGSLAVFLIIAALLFRNNRNKQKANALLQQQKLKVETTLSELKSTQQQLIQSEKMASLGELTAGIAHEIQNPLNFVNNFSEVNTELISELVGEVDKGNIEEVKALAKDIQENEEKINHHGKRAGDIVKGMLQHSRTSTGKKEPTDINALCDEYLRLAYHGLRAKGKNFNAEMKTDFDETLPKINIVAQDIGRVILNLINNAFYAVNEKKILRQAQGDDYQPTVSITTKKLDKGIEIKIADNGVGIPKEILDKIFQPFFTTKPTGQGTGLGLSLSYDIVKANGGEIKVETKEGEGTQFIVQLPV